MMSANITLSRFRPRAVATARARTSPGIARNTSVTRMISSSACPPKYPERAPRRDPIRVEMSTTVIPIRTEIEAPRMSPVRTSSPKVVVPSVW